jgi:hypothetical protein
VSEDGKAAARAPGARHAPASDAIEPKAVLRGGRDIVETSPRHREDFRNDAVDIGRHPRKPTVRVGVDRGEILDVQRLEPLLTGPIRTNSARHDFYIPSTD